MRKGDSVTYTNRGEAIRARVETIHKDGSATVTALFYQRDGNDVAGYLGFKYRLRAKDLTPTRELEALA